MNKQNKILNKDFVISPAGIAASVGIHLIFFLAGIFFLSFINPPRRSSSVVLSIDRFLQNAPAETPRGEEEAVREDEPAPEDKPLNESRPEQTAVSYSLNPADADTTGLKQVYTEPTRRVRIKYPAGWTFIDQNVKGKLDAVTFWSLSGKYDTPPYVFLEVKEKYLFNPSRYTDTLKTDYYTAFYNQPEETAGQISQIFYFRTDDDKDFSIKLIVKGRENFEMFQKEFFGMVKTFRFGGSFF